MVVRTADLSVVVVVLAVDVAAVAVDALVFAAATSVTVAGWSGAFVTYRCALAYPKELRKTPSVVRNPPSFSPQAGTGPERFGARAGPVRARLGGWEGEVDLMCSMNTGPSARCFEN